MDGLFFWISKNYFGLATFLLFQKNACFEFDWIAIYPIMSNARLVRNPYLWLLERRRRVKPPPSLLICGILMVLLPFLNYTGLSYSLHISPLHFAAILHRLKILEIIFIIAVVPVGIGLLLVKRWGWYAALAYGGALILHNSVVAVISRNNYNYAALGQTVLAFALMLYVVHKDISAPYMKMYPRGWRLEKRIPIQFEVLVDGIRRTALDVGEAGVYVEWPECYRKPGEEVQLTMRLGQTEHQCKAGIVRVDSKGAGIAFRETDPKFREVLKESMKRTVSARA